MAHGLVLFCLFPFLTLSSLSIVQSPALVKVPRGETVTLECNTVEMLIDCDFIYWFKVHERTRDFKPALAVQKGINQTVCIGHIYNTTPSDSGIYYCSGSRSSLSYTGAGSTLIVTESNPKPNIMLYVSDTSLGTPISLQCVVMRVIPSETSISWNIGGTALTGWTESGWTHGADSAPVEFMVSHLSIPSLQRGELNIGCVVRVDGQIFSKSMKQDYNSLCSVLLYLGSGVVFAIVTTVVVVTTMYLRSGKNQRKHSAMISTDMDVQYASLNLVRTGPSVITLNSNR